MASPEAKCHLKPFTSAADKATRAQVLFKRIGRSTTRHLASVEKRRHDTPDYEAPYSPHDKVPQKVNKTQLSSK
jgi:hypothetical protein